MCQKQNYSHRLQRKQIFIKSLAEAPRSPEMTNIPIYQIDLPIIILTKMNIMGSKIFLCEN
jgi:hypothetical protein